MDFQSMNPLNVRLNKISGNLLPMTANDASFPILWKIYSVLVWLLEILQTSVLIPGCLSVPKEKALKDGMIGLAITLEVFIVVARVHARRGPLQRLIRDLNDILRMEDEMMHGIVRELLKSMDAPLKFCWSAGVVSIFFWCSPPYILVFQKSSFFYVDYKMPVVYAKEPVSTSVYLAGSVVVSLSSMYIFTKKVSIDTYMIHMILLVTAQYRYIALKLSAILRDTKIRKNYARFDGKQYYPEADDQQTLEQMKTLCRHHNALVRVTLTLKEFLSLNFSLIYVNNVFRFCCIGLMVLVVASESLVEGFAVIIYACGGIIQLYILCFCVQQCLDATIEITDQAFHEEWYRYGIPVRRTFMMMIMVNNLDCKLSRFEKFSLSLPSFMAILNQSYSIAILLLRTH